MGKVPVNFPLNQSIEIGVYVCNLFCSWNPAKLDCWWGPWWYTASACIPSKISCYFGARPRNRKWLRLKHTHTHIYIYICFKPVDYGVIHGLYSGYIISYSRFDIIPHPIYVGFGCPWFSILQRQSQVLLCLRNPAPWMVETCWKPTNSGMFTTYKVVPPQL